MASAPNPNQQNYKAVTSLFGDFSIESYRLEQELKALELPEGETKSLLERSLEIASLEAKLDHQRQTLTKEPRTRRLTATSTRRSSDALYMNQWLRKIESVGNLNYPAEAKKQNINGKLRLLVAVKSDGTIHKLKVLETSGHKVLDDAAKNIVRQAAPFAPFPEEMRKDAEVLEIIRTWQFGNNLFATNL